MMMRVYLTDVDHFAEMNEIYNAYFEEQGLKAARRRPYDGVRRPARGPAHRDRRPRRPGRADPGCSATRAGNPAAVPCSPTARPAARRGAPDRRGAVPRSPLPWNAPAVQRSCTMLFPAVAAAAPPPPVHTGGILPLIGGTAGLLTVAVLGIALLLFLIIKVRLQPFVALLARLHSRRPRRGPVGHRALRHGPEVRRRLDRSRSGMGGILGHVAIIIGLGTMLGAILEVSGGAEVLSARLLNLFGEKRAPLAMGAHRPRSSASRSSSTSASSSSRRSCTRAAKRVRQVDPAVLHAAARGPVDDPRLPAAAPRPGRRRRPVPRLARLGHPDGRPRRRPRRARRLGLRRLDRQAHLRRRCRRTWSRPPRRPRPPSPPSRRPSGVTPREDAGAARRGPRHHRHPADPDPGSPPSPRSPSTPPRSARSWSSSATRSWP